MEREVCESREIGGCLSLISRSRLVGDQGHRIRQARICFFLWPWPLQGSGTRRWTAQRTTTRRGPPEDRRGRRLNGCRCAGWPAPNPPCAAHYPFDEWCKEARGIWPSSPSAAGHWQVGPETSTHETSERGPSGPPCRCRWRTVPQRAQVLEYLPCTGVQYCTFVPRRQLGPGKPGPVPHVLEYSYCRLDSRPTSSTPQPDSTRTMGWRAFADTETSKPISWSLA